MIRKRRAVADTHRAQAGVRRARLPHERDESADSQAPTADDIRRRAYEDAQRELPDTDRAPVLDEIYARNFRGSNDARTNDARINDARINSLRRRVSPKRR